jgi:hypothetical protein
MSAMHQLQLFLRDTGRYQGDIDGQYDSLTRGAVLYAMEDGPDTQLTDDDYVASSRRLRSGSRAFARSPKSRRTARASSRASRRSCSSRTSSRA